MGWKRLFVDECFLDRCDDVAQNDLVCVMKEGVWFELVRSEVAAKDGVLSDGVKALCPSVEPALHGEAVGYLFDGHADGDIGKVDDTMGADPHWVLHLLAFSGIAVAGWLVV